MIDCESCPNWRNCLIGYNPNKYKCPKLDDATYMKVVKKANRGLIPLEESNLLHIQQETLIPKVEIQTIIVGKIGEMKL